jgi:hypothetical protein
MLAENSQKSLVSGALLVALVSAVFFLGLSFNRGLEMSDEGAYLLVASDPWFSAAHGSFYGFALFPLWELACKSLAGFRWVGLLVWLLVCLYLSLGLRQALAGFLGRERSTIPGFWVAGSLLLASLSLYSDGIRTPNYNWLAHVGAALLLGSFFRGARIQGKAPTYLTVFLGVVGWVALAAGRWSSALTLLPLLAWGAWFVPQPGPARIWLIRVLGWTIPTLILAGYFYVGPDSLKSGWWSAKLIFAQTKSHGWWLVGQYGLNFLYYLYRVARAAIWIVPLVVIFWSLSRVPRFQNVFGSRLIPWVCLAAVVLALIRGYWKGGAENFSKESVLAGLWLGSLAWIGWRSGEWRSVLPGMGWWVGLCAALPWLLGLATDTSLADYAGHGTVFSAAAGWLLLAPMAVDKKNISVAGALILSLGLLQATRAASSTIFSYRIGNVWNLDSRIGAGPENGRIIVDASTADLVRRLDAAMRTGGFQAGDSIVALTDMPGLVYLLGGKSPGVPWYFGMSPRLAGPNGEFTRFVLESLPATTLEGSWILYRQKTSIPRDLRRIWPLEKAGLPRDTALEIPWDTHFYPKERVHLYAPFKSRDKG